MKPLFIIPARGGSRGIPGKNIKLLDGKPLIGYSIEVAMQLTDRKNICVTTDDEKIANVAREMYGLDVPFLRPAELASDTAGSREVMLHALDFFNQRGNDYDTIVLLQPTSPFRSVDDVKGCMDLYTSGLDLVVSVKEAASNPYYNCFETDEEGFLHISKGDGLFTRRQDAPKAWEYNGAVYVINAKSLKDMPMGKFPHRKMYPMPADRSIDLDTMFDWLVAEAMIKQKNQ